MEAASNAAREHGVALVVVLLAVALMSALGAALALSTTAETLIAMNFRRSREALYAADAAAQHTLDDLRVVADWSTLLDGTVASSFVDGVAGTRQLDDGSTIDLATAVDMANCQKTTACSDGDMNTVTDDRPWGPNNPRWKLFGYGHLRQIVSDGSIESPFYVIAMIGDDPGETDGDPSRDGDPGTPGAGIFAVRAEAFGPNGAHRVVELTVMRDGTAARLLTWRELR